MKLVIVIEALLTLMVLATVVAGIFIARSDLAWFEAVYVVEDGVIEWLTSIFLFNGFILCLYRAWTLRKSRPTIFIAATLLLSSLFLFGAGEEISWGQRIFNIQSPEFFQTHNSQKETNFHNLILSGKKINKIIFGTFLGIVSAFYFLFLPFLYKRKPLFQKLVDTFAVPLPRLHHSLLFGTIFILVSLVASPKRGELMEFAGCFAFFFVVFNPMNIALFTRDGP